MRWRLRALTGVLAGIVIYAINMYCFTLLFPWFKLSREPIGNGPVPEALADSERQFLHINPVGTPSCALVSTRTLRAVGGFDQQTSVMADWDLWIRLATISRPAVSPSFSESMRMPLRCERFDIMRVWPKPGKDR